mmetsp:Transcript_5882/g.26037  ORF Transcript_5882/g.26037 Transcript_5882/m.26037 type:complete len:895 (+) Transcript_5882:1021-3705(+)
MRKRHLEDRGDDAAVAHVVARGDEPLVNAELGRLPRLLEVRAVVHVGGVVAHLVVSLSQRGPAEPALALLGAKLHEHELAGSQELEIGGDRLRDVRDGDVPGHHDGSGSLDHLAAGAGRHGERILAAVDGHVELAHRLAERGARVKHVRAVAGKLRRVHPVARVLDVLETGRVCEDEVGEGLAESHSRHRLRVDHALDGLLADARGAAGDPVVGLRDDADVRDRHLQRPDALLLRDEPGDGPVHLGGQEALAAHRRKAEDAVESVRRGGPLRKFQSLGLEVHALEVVRLLGHVAEHLLEVEVLGNRRALGGGGVHEFDAAAAVDAAEDAKRAPLSRANLLDDGQRLGRDEHRAVLLVLRAPYLEHGEGGVAELHRSDVELAALGVDELLAHVAVAPRALVVDGENRVPPLELHARLDDAVELVGHLRIPALHRVEVEVGVRLVLAASLGGRRAAAHADAIRRPANLHHEHADVALLLLQVGVVDLAEPAAEHDGLDPLASFAVGQALTERSAVPRDERLAELVPVIARAVGRVDENLKRRRQVAGVVKVGVLVRLDVVGDLEVTDAVPCGTRGEQRADAGGVGIAHAPAGASLRTRVGRDARGEVVRLRGEQEVEVDHAGRERGRAARVDGPQRRVDESSNGGGVVFKRNDRVVSALALDRLLDHLEQALGLGDAVDDEVTAEEPVARVLAVGLAHVEELDVGRVAADVVPEEREVVVEVLLVKGESHLLVHLLERRPTLGEDRNGVDLLRDGIGRERRQRGVVDALGHPIVDERGEREFGAVVDRLTGGGHEGVAPGALQAGHLAKSGVLADGHRVGGPRGLKREPRAHLDDVAVELGRLGEEVGLESLAQEPLERGQLVGRERGGDLDVEALLGDHGRDRAVHGVLGVGLAA